MELPRLSPKLAVPTWSALPLLEAGNYPEDLRSTEDHVFRLQEVKPGTEGVPTYQEEKP